MSSASLRLLDTRAGFANLGQVYRDDDGRPLRMIGVVYDVTDRKLTERALRDSEETFRSIVEATSEWIWAIDETRGLPTPTSY